MRPMRYPVSSAGDLLADAWVGAVGPLDGELVERPVRHETIDAAALVFELRHRLFERVALDADEVDDRARGRR